MPKKQNLQNLPELEEESDEELEYVANPIKTKPIDAQQQVTEKKKRNITEEHKQVLRDRLKMAHQRKQELAVERRKQKELTDNEFQKQKEAKILQEADKLKKKQDKALKAIEVASLKPKKKPVFVYVDEDSSDEEEEQIVVKSKKKPQKQQPLQQSQPVIPVYQKQVNNESQPFKIKFV